MGLEIVTLSEVRERRIPLMSLICGIQKKKDTNELTYEAEMDSQTWKIKVHYQRGNVREEG